MHIAIVRRDIEIADHDEPVVGGEFRGQPYMGALQPVELVDVLVRVDALAVGHIQADDAHAVDSRRQHAFLRIVKIGNRSLRGGRGSLAQYGDAVIGFLPAIEHLVAGSLDFLRRKFRVFELGFLQTQYIGLLRFQPLDDLRQADFEGINVPGRDPHYLAAAGGDAGGLAAGFAPGIAVVG